MNNQTMHERNGKSLAAIVNQLKTEFTEFARTRYEMLRAELAEKASAWKTAIPVLVIALLFALTAFWLLTGALVTLVAVRLGVGWALLIVGGAYLILGVVMGWIGYAELKAN
ncbi:MAG: phage holin family protein, partial [Acidobacteriales bacterium]|nr:phage holin family protein [Terriglobales bacterium]